VEDVKVDKLSEVTDEEWSLVNIHNQNITSEFLKQDHLSLKTIEQYGSALKLFFRWVYINCENKPLYKLKPDDALGFQNFLLDRNLSGHSVTFKRSAVSTLCTYMETYHLEDKNYRMFRNIYTKKIPNPSKEPRRERETLTQEEFEKLYRELRKRQEWQMIAYLIFSYSTGCRRGEAIQLEKEVVNYQTIKDDDNIEDFYHTHLIRCKGKGKEGEIKNLKFDDRSMKAIKKWILVRGEDNCPYVFVNKTKNGTSKLAMETFNYWCRVIFSKILGRRVHPQGLCKG
jgi:integrase